MGGKLPWVIAALVGGLLAIFIVWVVFFPQPTLPTLATAAAGKLELKTPAAAITLVLPAAASGGGDAGDDYKQAIDKYDADRQAIRAVLRRDRGMILRGHRLSEQELLTLRPVRQAIARAATKAKMTFYFRHTPKVVEPPFMPKMRQQFQELWNVLEFLALYNIALGQDNYEQAQQCLLDGFTMGWHLVQERSRLDMVGKGLAMMKDACDGLVYLYGPGALNQPQRRTEVERYRDELDLASIAYWELEMEVIRHLPPHPGDIFNLAENHADPAVRRMATLWLGVVRLTCTQRGDNRHVRKLIAQKLNSEDEIERACALAASKLDQVGLNLMKRPPPVATARLRL